jgi:hypothetical protein
MAGIRDPEITYPGPRIRKAPRIPDPDPQHCIQSRTISRAETEQLASYAQPLEDKFLKRSTAITLRSTVPSKRVILSLTYNFVIILKKF